MGMMTKMRESTSTVLWVLVFAAISLGALVVGAGLLLSATAGVCLPVVPGSSCPAT